MSDTATFDLGVQTEQLADQVSRQWDRWDAGRAGWKQKYREVQEYVYATSTETTTNADLPWSHTTHIPKLTQIYDNLGSQYADALFGSDDWMDFIAANESATLMKRRTAVIAYLRTKHEQSDFYQTMNKLLDDFVMAGNCFAMVIYVDQRAEFNGEVIDQYTGPKVIRISPLDIVFDYTATSFRNAPKIIRRVVHLGDLLKEIEDRPDSGYDQTKINELTGVRGRVAAAEAEDVIKNVQRHFDGFTDPAAYYSSGMVEVLEFFGDIFDESTGELLRNQHIVIADRDFVLRKGEVENWFGNGHVYHAGWRKRQDNLWAQGPLENLLGMQYLIDHLENAKADAFDKMLSPDRVVAGNVEEEEDGPVTTYYIDDANGSVQNLAPDAQVLNAEFQIQRKEQQMESYAGAPSEAMGIRTPGEKTAFEVGELASAAQRLFLKRSLEFSREGLEPILQAELEVAHRNLRGSDVAKVIDDDLGVVEFMRIKKSDLTAKGTLRAMGARHFAIRSKRVQEITQFQQVLGNDAELKVHFPALKRAKMLSSLMSSRPDELFEKFGAIAEQVELAKFQQTAQGEIERFGTAEETIDDEQLAALDEG